MYLLETWEHTLIWGEYYRKCQTPGFFSFSLFLIIIIYTRQSFLGSCYFIDTTSSFYLMNNISTVRLKFMKYGVTSINTIC